MSNGLAELQAGQILQKMRSLRGDVLTFTAQAKLMNSAVHSIDSLVLMQEADRLLKGLMAARVDFQDVEANVNSVKRSLPSKVPQGVGIPPAALWGSELRAASKQFVDAVRSAEEAVQKLYKTSEQGMNSPLRTSTGNPSSAFEVLITFIEALNKLIEHFKKKSG